MKLKYSKTQLEVWELKNNLYEEIKDIPRGNKLDSIAKKVGKTVE